MKAKVIELDVNLQGYVVSIVTSSLKDRLINV